MLAQRWSALSALQRILHRVYLGVPCRCLHCSWSWVWQHSGDLGFGAYGMAGVDITISACSCHVVIFDENGMV